jgi:hypothetical protein
MTTTRGEIEGGYYADRAPSSGEPLATWARRGDEPKGARLYVTRLEALEAAARRWRCARVREVLGAERRNEVARG